MYKHAFELSIQLRHRSYGTIAILGEGIFLKVENGGMEICTAARALPNLCSSQGQYAPVSLLCRCLTAGLGESRSAGTRSLTRGLESGFTIWRSERGTGLYSKAYLGYVTSDNGRMPLISLEEWLPERGLCRVSACGLTCMISGRACPSSAAWHPSMLCY